MNPLLSTLVYANFVEAMREFGRWQQSSQVLEQEGLLFVAGSTAFPIFMNYTIRLDANVPAAEVIDKSKAFFPIEAKLARKACKLERRKD